MDRYDRTFADLAARIDKPGCYIALMPTDIGFDLEIETSDGEISGVWSTGSDDIDEARQQANLLEAELKRRGIHVLPDREQWENFLGGREYED